MSTERESRPTANWAASSSTRSDPHYKAVVRQAGDGWAVVQRRAAEAARSHKAPVGHYACGYREGYQRALRYMLDAIEDHLDELGRAKAEAIVSRIGGDDDI
jgi:hypothetical protein